MESIGQMHPVDQVLSPGKLLTLGIQHVLVMYAGAVAVPLIIGGALHFPKDQVAYLISCDLFACGVALAFSRSASVPSAFVCRLSWRFPSPQSAPW